MHVGERGGGELRPKENCSPRGPPGPRRGWCAVWCGGVGAGGWQRCLGMWEGAGAAGAEQSSLRRKLPPSEVALRGHCSSKDSCGMPSSSSSSFWAWQRCCFFSLLVARGLCGVGTSLGSLRLPISAVPGLPRGGLRGLPRPHISVPSFFAWRPSVGWNWSSILSPCRRCGAGGGAVAGMRELGCPPAVRARGCWEPPRWPRRPARSRRR